jgi:hypothetical protein
LAGSQTIFKLEREEMKFNEIRKMGKNFGVNTYRMAKIDMIRVNQRTEDNFDCFGTERVDQC